jgi:WS/DGAT/MGAT family acyltransferase
MQNLSGLDAAFLSLETPSAHMHIMGVSIVDPSTLSDSVYPTFYDRVRALFEARIHLIPPFRRRVVNVPFGLNVPAWIDDPDFDLDYHVQRAALPAPGGPKELEAFAASVASRPLDRNKPLWEAYVVEGLEHGHQAFIAKIHHSLIDGVAGVSIIQSLFDFEEGAPLVPAADAPDTFSPQAVPGETEMLTRAVLSLGTQPRKLVRAVTRSVPGLVRAVRRARDEALNVALPLTAPRLTMNRKITAHRVISFASVPLADVKAVKDALGLTVNDVVLAVNAGALRQYLQSRSELPDTPLVAAIPTSVRAADDQGFGNRVSSMFASLPVELSDPLDRVNTVAESMSGAKGVHEEISDTTLADWAELVAPALFSRAMRTYSRLRIGERLRPAINVVVSNVPGPPFPLYFAGARLVALHPLGPIFDDAGLNVTVMSYLDHIDFGFIGCRELLPDIDDLAAAIPDALSELKKAAGV